jgi:hypothetical protein
MFRRITKALTRKTESRAPKARLQIESLEDRTLMTAQPFVLGTVQEATDFGATTSAAKAVSLAAMQQTQVKGNLSNASDVDMFRVDLRKGQIFTAQAQLSASASLTSPAKGTAHAMLSLLNSQGSVVVASGVKEQLVCRVDQDGVYYVKLTRDDAKGATASTRRLYELDLRPIGLDNANTDPNLLRKNVSGAMAEYVWLNGDTLQISGPTGHGFSIRGNWVQTTSQSNGMISSTYSVTGTVYLVTALGDIRMSISDGQSLSVSSKPQLNGDFFGEVRAVDFNVVTFTVGQLRSTFGIKSQFGVGDMGIPDDTVITLSGRVGGFIGVGLGSDAALQSTKLPLNAAVPYLYFSVNTVVAGQIALVADPSDPALFIKSTVQGLPIGPVEIQAIGFSQHGLIPYTPTTTPSQYTGQLSGHVLLQGSVDTTSITVIPSKVDGDITLNLDPNRTGKFLGGYGVTAADLVSLFTDAPVANANFKEHATEVFKNLSVGINGTLRINPFADQQDAFKEKHDGELAWLFSGRSFTSRALDWASHKALDKGTDHEALELLRIGEGSLIYDGPSLSAYFRGRSVNPFEQALKDTPLAQFVTKVGIDLDAAIKFGGKDGGGLYLDAQGDWVIGMFPAHGEVLVAINYPLTGRAAQVLADPSASGSAGTPATSGGIGNNLSKQPKPVTGVFVGQKINLFVGDIDVYGKVLANGNFILSGQADLNLGSALKGNVQLTLARTSSGLTLKAALHGQAEFSATVAGTKWKAKVTVDGTLTITRKSNGKWHFEGSLSATGKVTSPVGSANFSVNVEVTDNDLVIDIPHIGKKHIPLN